LVESFEPVKMHGPTNPKRTATFLIRIYLCSREQCSSIATTTTVRYWGQGTLLVQLWKKLVLQHLISYLLLQWRHTMTRIKKKRRRYLTGTDLSTLTVTCTLVISPHHIYISPWRNMCCIIFHVLLRHKTSININGTFWKENIYVTSNTRPVRNC